MRKSVLIHLKMEQARSHLHELAKKYNGFLHPEVIKQSVILDKLIDQFNHEAESKNKADG
ncbi:Spo0E like sporulation regulatory protein [Paenibacillus polysaccharolyticus]|uniref:Spo0E like sporulation regulatory protein n=1 Tax=Paenibacillus polysaccharolyticus TaxID=582692 RepID=A0A1G5J5K0_9BACL|nr:aspartyl-phosphate phosphatase Spo0E family protein [Paenibacillus polysaccharolyticus]SCY83474.1 Spo0E like sporulation regulatory protein [Paenibacillus polysaccharolyticus]